MTTTRARAFARPILLAAFAAVCAAAPAARAATLPVGDKPPTVSLSGDDGGRTDGSPWSSDMIKGKVYVLFYVDPDHESANPDLEKGLKDANLPHDKFGTIAVINMAATWKPNAIISSVLKSRQEEFPDTIYVKDYDSVLVKKWKMTDKDYDVVVFDKQGKVLLARDGEFTKAQVTELIELVRKHLDDPS